MVLIIPFRIRMALVAYAEANAYETMPPSNIGQSNEANDDGGEWALNSFERHSRSLASQEIRERTSSN